MTLPFTQLGNNTPPILKFELFSENGNIVCDLVPLEYESLLIGIRRDIDLAWVFVEFKVVSKSNGILVQLEPSELY